VSSVKEVGVILGGPQGSGLETSMNVLARALASRGYWLIADREYYSNITGRHSYIHMLVSSDKQARSLRYPVEVIAAMDAETIFTHFLDISERGVLLYDTYVSSKTLSEVASMEEHVKSRIENNIQRLGLEPDVKSILKHLSEDKHISAIGIDYSKVLKNLSEKYNINARFLSRYLSGLIVSAVALILGIEDESVKEAFQQYFKEKTIIAEQNFAIYEMLRKQLEEYIGLVKLDPPAPRHSKIMVASGNDVVAMGKIVAGVRYQSYYPITPAADESFLLEKHSDILSKYKQPIGSLIVLQTEDEISAITSAIGASLTGVRSSTSTSGPGFDLMIEGISWAGMNETPVVITYYQRGGPSTGQPTRGAQSDLFNAVFAGHGEFSRIVLSSGDHIEAFYDTIMSFNLAEKFQVPVIHLLDKFLANSLATMDIPSLKDVLIERGYISKGGTGYKRFSLNSLISPRAPLGSEETVMWYTGDEHDEYGHICEDPEIRVKMYSKRIEKDKIILESISLDYKFALYGGNDFEYLLLGWGSVKGVALDAVDKLREKGLKVSYLNIKLLWPFPTLEFRDIVKSIPEDRLIAVEHSYGVNIASLIRQTTGININKKISKYTGRPITLSELLISLDKIISKETNRVVFTYGE